MPNHRRLRAVDKGDVVVWPRKWQGRGGDVSTDAAGAILWPCWSLICLMPIGKRWQKSGFSRVAKMT